MKYLIFTILTIFGVMISGVLKLAGHPVWFPQYAGLLFCLFLGISLVLWDFNKYLSIFTLICLYSTFFVTKMYPRAIMLLVQLDLGCLAAYGISRFNRQQRKIIVWAVLVLVLMQFCYMIVQAYDKDPIFFSTERPGRDEQVGLSASKDQIGTFFAITLPIMLYIFPPLALISLAGIFISKSSFAIVAGSVAGLFYLWFKSRKLFMVSLIIAILSMGIFFTKVDKLIQKDRFGETVFRDFATRVDVWKYSIVSTLKGKIDVEVNGRKVTVDCQPWRGYGFGNFLTIFPYVPEQDNFNYANEKFTHAHNDYAELFFELGFLGMIGLFFVIMSLFGDFALSTKTNEMVLYSSCILAYILNATGNFISQIAVSGMLLIIFYGMFKGEANG